MAPNKMNVADKLIIDIIKTKSPIVVGLDPDIVKIPNCYKRNKSKSDRFSDVTEIIIEFNKDIIDTVCGIVPAVKPQIAFYEKYGWQGIRAFEQTVEYAHSKGLTVIADAKRNDIGNTALAYAQAFLGKVDVLYEKAHCINADFLTVSPFLGSESLEPFIQTAKENKKGVFILIKTSNVSSGEIQNIPMPNGKTVSQNLAEYTAKCADSAIGEFGYSPIGAVIGATYPNEAEIFRALMPQCLFLVPGYGAQGGKAGDVIPCFNSDGLGAVVNSSRAILYSHVSDIDCSKEKYLSGVRNAALNMRREIYNELKTAYKNMKY